MAGGLLVDVAAEMENVAKTRTENTVLAAPFGFGSTAVDMGHSTSRFCLMVHFG